MPIVHKTFTKTLNAHADQKDFAAAFEDIDNQVNEYLGDQHWSQSRDAFGNIEEVSGTVVITRTIVHTTEVLAQTPPQRPPV